jgi:hypothetical protein
MQEELGAKEAMAADDQAAELDTSEDDGGADDSSYKLNP